MLHLCRPPLITFLHHPVTTLHHIPLNIILPLAYSSCLFGVGAGVTVVGVMAADMVVVGTVIDE